MQKVFSLQTCIHWYIILLLGIFSFLFIPVTQNFFDTSKWVFITIGTLILVVLWSIDSVNKKSISVSLGKSSVVSLIFLASSLVSLVMVSENKIEAATAFFGPGIFAGLAILSLFGSTYFTHANKRDLLWSLFIASGISGLVCLYQIIGLGTLLFPSVAFFSDTTWTPVGSVDSFLGLLSISLPFIIHDLFGQIKKKEIFSTVWRSILILIIIGSGIYKLITVLPTYVNTTIPISEGWSIALESMKQPLHAIVGSGIESFMTAATSAKSVAMNATPLWNARFFVSSSLGLHLITTQGILSLIAILATMFSLFVSLFKRHKTGFDYALGASSILFIISLFVVPPSLLVIMYIFILLTLSETKTLEIHTKLSPTVQWFAMVVLFCLIGLSAIGIYAIGRFFYGEIKYNQSLVALNKKDGLKTYYYQIDSIRINPYISTYHIGLSQTSIGLATAISQNSVKQNLASNSAEFIQSRQNIVNLVQQAVFEAKQAVILSAHSVVGWENVGATYAQLIGIATDADKWAVAGYQRAIQLDPTNPLLRIRLGSIYLRLNDPLRAREQFFGAISLKSDLANAHYGLAYVLKLQKEYPSAALELERSLGLLAPTSSDYQRVQSELSEVKDKLTKEQSLMVQEILKQDQLTAQQTTASQLPDNAVLSPISGTNQPLPAGL